MVQKRYIQHQLNHVLSLRVQAGWLRELKSLLLEVVLEHGLVIRIQDHITVVLHGQPQEPQFVAEHLLRKQEAVVKNKLEPDLHGVFYLMVLRLITVPRRDQELFQCLNRMRQQVPNHVTHGSFIENIRQR